VVKTKTWGWLIALLLAAAVVLAVLLIEPKHQPPNIVIIIADDMGWADVGYHNKRVQTPNLDQLAR